MVGDRSWTNTEIICTYDRRLVSGGRIHAEACLVAANKTNEVSPSRRDAKSECRFGKRSPVVKSWSRIRLDRPTTARAKPHVREQPHHFHANTYQRLRALPIFESPLRV